MQDILEQFQRIFAEAALSDSGQKEVLQAVVAQFWGAMPPWSPWPSPRLQETPGAAMCGGVALTYAEAGVQKIVLAQAGEHYRDPALPPAYMVFGGFADLVKTKGSLLVRPAESPENIYQAIARETEEEFRTDQGEPVLAIDPDRLQIMDNKVLTPRGGTLMAFGAMLELNPNQVIPVKQHVARMGHEAYRRAASEHTRNEYSRKPEVASVAIFDLKDAAMGCVPIHHGDQRSLFQRISRHFNMSFG